MFLVDPHKISASRIARHPLRKPSLLFLASLLLLCLSCWRLCCCWFSVVMGISAVIVGVPAVATSLLFFRHSCWFLTLVGVPAVADSLLSGIPAVACSLLFMAPCCCWLVHGCFWRPCGCWFPTAVGVCAVVASLLLTNLIFPSVL